MMVACLALSAAAQADQRDPRLPALFEQLKSAANLEAAQPIEAEIWEVWAQSENDDVNLLMGIAINAMAREDYATALELFDKMVEVAPDFAEGWNKRATVYFLMGEYRKSLADCEEVLKRNPNHFGVLSGYGQIYLQLNEPERALSYFERALAVNPNMEQVEQVIEELKSLLMKQKKDTI